MKALLRFVLIVVGLLTLLPSVAGIFVPWQRIINVVSWWQVTLPAVAKSEITVYLFRVMCVTYAWAGFLFLLAAANPPKYLVLMRTLALASICVGLACILVGTKLAIPAWGYLTDGIFCLVSGILIWTLSTTIGQTPAQAAPPEQSAP